MKTNRIYVTGTFRSDDTVNFKVTETIFTGEGTLDFTDTLIEEGTTTESLYNEENDEDLTESFFSNKYGKEGFDFRCMIDQKIMKTPRKFKFKVWARKSGSNNEFITTQINCINAVMAAKWLNENGYEYQGKPYTY